MCDISWDSNVLAYYLRKTYLRNYIPSHWVSHKKLWDKQYLTGGKQAYVIFDARYRTFEVFINITVTVME